MSPRLPCRRVPPAEPWGASHRLLRSGGPVDSSGRPRSGLESSRARSTGVHDHLALLGHQWGDPNRSYISGTADRASELRHGSPARALKPLVRNEEISTGVESRARAKGGAGERSCGRSADHHVVDDLEHGSLVPRSGGDARMAIRVIGAGGFVAGFAHGLCEADEHGCHLGDSRHARRSGRLLAGTAADIITAPLRCGNTTASRTWRSRPW